MSNFRLAATTALTMMLAAGTAAAEEPIADALPSWAAAVAGDKLVAVDGSAVTLSSGEGGLSLTRFSPSGATQLTNFSFMADKLGTVSDGDGGRVKGFFRVTDTGLEAQYSDGHSESLFANTGGGISLSVNGAARSTSCMSWYPAGHVFGVAERRAAVAAYAASLGLDQPAKGKAPVVATCTAAAKARAVAARSHYTIGETSPGLLAPLTPVAVRTSDVQVVPVVPASLPSALPLTAAAPVLASPLPAQANKPRRLASTAVAGADLTSEAGHGASDCLRVESDGASLGFRNRCLFNVQFVYCLQSKDDPRAICNIETRTGNVQPKAFVALLPDANIKPEDAEHDFRWVACSGTSNDVTAYLDRAEPPSGRCVRANAS